MNRAHAKPAVSVIVPLYNKAQTVRRTIDSIANQTVSNVEIIVVDDGSTDAGPEIVGSYAGAKIRLIRQINRGPGAARNRGLTEARGEFVSFLDADDVWEPERLYTGLKYINSLGPEVATTTCGYREFPAGLSREQLWRKRGIKEGVQQLFPDMKAMTFVHTLAYVSPCTTIARTAIVRRWEGFYEHGCRYGEDAILWLKVLLNERFHFHFDPLVGIHREDSSLGTASRLRPLEPFLADPETVRLSCPAPLKCLLEQFLAARACKTAAVFGYWGQWRAAQTTFRRFVRPCHWRLPYFFPGLIASTPVAAFTGRILRLLR